MKARVAFLLAAALAASAARAGLFDDDEARRQIAELKAQIEANQKALEQRLDQIQSAQSDRAVDLAQQLDALKEDLAKLRGQVEVLGNQADTLERKQKELYLDLDARMRKIEQQQAQLQSQHDAQAEKQAYEAALNQFKVGNYQLAISGFQSFMTRYPNSSLLPSAQYWIGNAYFAMRDYKAAIAAQQKVIANWPDDPKAADAMLNIASAQSELGQSAAARETLRALIKRYPSTAAAGQAKQRLARR